MQHALIVKTELSHRDNQFNLIQFFSNQFVENSLWFILSPYLKGFIIIIRISFCSKKQQQSMQPKKTTQMFF